MHILIVKIGAAGDVLRTTSLLPGLVAKYPGAHIHWLTETAHRDILTGHPLINEVLCADDLPTGFSNRSYGLVINIDEDQDVCQLISRLRVGQLIGTYIRNGIMTYTPDSAIRFDMSRMSHLGLEEADRLKLANRRTYQEICYGMLGIPFAPACPRPLLVIPQSEQAFAREFADANSIRPHDMVIGINTGSGQRWPNKRLSIPDTIELIACIERRHPEARIMVIGGPSEAGRNSEIRSQAPRVIDPGCHHPIKRFAALVNLCSTLVTSDSLTLHVATALEKRVVVFFGPTSPWEIELYGNGEKILPQEGCVGCFKPKCAIPLKFDVDEIARAV